MKIKNKHEYFAIIYEWAMTAIALFTAAIFFNWKMSLIVFLTIWAANTSMSRILANKKKEEL